MYKNLLRKILEEYNEDRVRGRLKQADLARMLKVTYLSVWNWFTNKKQPNQEHTNQLCEILGCIPEDIFYFPFRPHKGLKKDIDRKK